MTLLEFPKETELNWYISRELDFDHIEFAGRENFDIECEVASKDEVVEKEWDAE